MNQHRSTPGVVSSAQAEYDALRCVSEESPCPYLPGRMARHEAYQVEELAPRAYEGLLGRGFRRSGRVVYRPRCRACRECRQLRIPVGEFRPTHSMRRVLRRNSDVRVRLSEPAATDEKFRVFQRYLDAQHDRSMARTRDAFEGFLYDSPTETLEFTYFLGERLMGASIADRVPGGLSSVYMYFDPEFSARSPGTMSILWEIGFCRREGLVYYYLGYFVAECSSMSYKARFRTHQILVSDDRWLTYRERGG